MQNERPTWDQYFMRMAFLAASRSNCTRRKVGAVIVKDKNVLATGYNGPPSGTVHCDVVGCIRDELDVPSGERHELCRGLHAEQNAIIQAAVHGVSIKDAVIYVTTHPCVVCSKMLMNARSEKSFTHRVIRTNFRNSCFLKAILKRGALSFRKERSRQCSASSMQLLPVAIKERFRNQGFFFFFMKPEMAFCIACAQ